jgi:cytoskeletal protein RodZ
MYEQNDVPVFRHILWLALWFVVIVAVLWTLVWLIFFRGSDSTSVKAPKHPATSQPATVPTPSSTGITTTPNATPTTAPTVATTPTQLVNTGAGDVFVPFAVATVVGSTFYYIRTRRKLLQ